MTTLSYDNVLVTGAAGFIGYHLSRRLLADGCRVTGIDNLTPYYDVQLKKDRLARLTVSSSLQIAMTFFNARSKSALLCSRSSLWWASSTTLKHACSA